MLDGKINVEWETYSEINNNFFLVEWSKDGREYKSIGTVDGAGNSSERISYTLVHDDPVSGLNYYRIKQVDYDGSYAYSDVVSERVKSDQTEIILTPSLVQNNLYVSVDEIDHVAIFAMNGQRKMELKNINSGSIDLSGLLAGVYVVKINSGNIRHTQKIVKQ